MVKRKIEVVCNSSPIIGLSKIHRLDLIENLYGEITIPNAVYEELVIKGYDKEKIDDIKSLIDKNIIRVREVGNRELIRALRKDLDIGESEVIALALEMKANVVILDEKDARDIADMYDLRKTGLVGILIRAKQKGLIKSVQEDMDKLIEAGFRINESLYRYIIQSLTENGV
jgi:predicted nucleic acid-binding protein